MDSQTSSLDSNVDLSKLSARDKQELQQFLMNESQKSMILQSSHKLTEMCWTKCVTGTIKIGALDRSEEPCLKNCVDRFLDANFAIIRKLEGLQRGQ